MSAYPDEDRLAELLADRVIAMVDSALPTAGPLLRRRAARLYLRQLTGRAAPPGRITQQDLAAALGLSRAATARLETRALLKSRDALARRGLGYRSLLAILASANQQP